MNKTAMLCPENSLSQPFSPSSGLYVFSAQFSIMFPLVALEGNTDVMFGTEHVTVPYSEHFDT